MWFCETLNDKNNHIAMLEMSISSLKKDVLQLTEPNKQTKKDTVSTSYIFSKHKYCDWLTSEYYLLVIYSSKMTS